MYRGVVGPSRGVHHPIRAAAVALAVIFGLFPSQVRADAYAPPGLTERLVSADGTELNADVFSEPPGISADGRFISFSSFASNLVEGDPNGTADVFVLDRSTGNVERVSESSEGVGGGSESSLSADGRFVAFTSWSDDLDPRDDNETYDVFVHDRHTDVTEMVSITDEGIQGDFGAELPAISADGRFVTFTWHARNLPGDDNAASDVYVHDRLENTTELVSLAHDGTQGDDSSEAATISADGRYVAFASEATNLVPLDTNWAVERRHGWDVFVRDRETETTQRVSVAGNGNGGNGRAMHPRISADGSVVAFLSGATNLVPQDTNSSFDVFIHDLVLGRTERVALTSEGVQADGGFAGNFVTMSLSLSSDGQIVAFGSTSTNLVEGDGSTNPDVFVHDRAIGSTERISVPSEETGIGGGNHPTINADGSVVAFVSGAADIVAGDTNGSTDLFVRNRGLPFAPTDVQVTAHGSSLNVDGWVRLPGEIVARAVDRDDDGGAAARGVGGELTGAEVALRPETDDLFASIDLAALPGFRPPEAAAGYPSMGGFLVCPDCVIPSAGGIPTVVYGLELDAGDFRYEVRATRLTADGDPLGTFSLHRCSPECERLGTVAGGYGTATEEIRFSVPLDLLADIDQVRRARAFALAGDPDGDGFLPLDEVPLEKFEMSEPSIDLGVARRGTPRKDVGFIAGAALSDGRFTGSIDVPIVPGEYDVWARACLGEVCGAKAVPVSVGSPDPDPTPTQSPTASPSPSPSESPVPETTTLAFTEGSSTSGQFSDETLFEARLTDSNDDPIAGAEVTFELAGPESSRSFPVITDDQGIASVSPVLEAKSGPYQLTVRYPGDDSRAGSADTAAFVVDREDSDLALSAEGRGRNRALEARLSDRDEPSRGIARATIDFYSDGELIGEATTDEDGIATLQLPPRYRGANHDFEARFEGDDYHLDSSDKEET